VIATPAHWTGLHLHGLNTNTAHFNTLPPDQVSSFALEFGFIPTKYVTLQTLDEVRQFTSEASRTGSWEGEMIEGFVVRSTVLDAGAANTDSKPPYRPGSPFFFKVKFEEPYLLYRTWREVTRTMLPLLKSANSDQEEQIRKKVKNKTKRPDVAVYVDWIDRMLREEPELFDNFERGVVKVRERFLKWTEGEGKAEWEAALAGKPLPKRHQADVSQPEADSSLRRKAREGMTKKYVLVPIAVPGCGRLYLLEDRSKLTF
jgi:tRNA ligase